MTQSIPAAAAAAPVTTSPTPVALTGRLASMGPTTIVVAAVLTSIEWWTMHQPENAAGPAAAIGALALTLPLLVARRRPLVAVALLAAAAVANGLLFGDFVRCAAAFPAVLFAAFAVGAWNRDLGRGRGWSSSLVGIVLAIAALVAQYRWDPALHSDVFFLVMGPGLVLVAWGAGTGWDALMARRGRR